MQPPPFAELSEHGVERNHPCRQVVELAQLGADWDEVVPTGELQAVPGVVEKRHVGVDRPQREFIDGALHRRQIEVELEGDLEPERL